MKIEKNTDIFVLRFSDKNKIDTIAEHQSLLYKNGFVWYGKIGVTPRKRYFEDHLKDGQTYVLLTKPGSYYIGECVEYSLLKPSKGRYPCYYDSKEFQGYKFTSWYKLTKIIEVSNRDVLESIVIKSSGNYLRSALQGSMSPMFKAKTIEEIIVNDERD